jgi:hypothetical protein
LRRAFELLLAGVAQALQVRGFQHAQGIRAVLLDAPAELLFHHEAIEQHDIGGQLADKGIETAVIELDSALRRCPVPARSALCSPIAGWAAERDMPSLALQKTLDDLHHMPAGRRRAGLGPDVADNQDVGGRLTFQR